MTEETLVTIAQLINMEIATVEDDTDPPILIDSGTESFNESPVAEEGNVKQGSVRRQKSVKNILDKSISVDEDSLIKPLEPIVCNIIHSKNLNNNNRDDGQNGLQIMSILRRTSFYDVSRELDLISTPRRVSFPIDLDTLASYKEPDVRSPFYLSETYSCDDILMKYQNSCKKHHTLEQDVIKNQILEIKNNLNNTATLNLASINVTMEVCDTLEDLFKVVNFNSITIKDCHFTLESIREFINILEYYNCTKECIISDHFKELEAWKLFCSMTSKSYNLESLTLENFSFNDTFMKVLLSHLKNNSKIHTLKLNSCKLSNLPTCYLVENLILNTTIQELYLPQTGLYTKEADLLGRLLSKNFTLQVLDISNNLIGDRGLEVLSKGLCYQTVEGCGLSVLVIFNNQITEKSAPVIGNIIAECINLHTLNIGYNNLTDEVVVKMEESLQKTKSLEGLGLQNTLLTDKGICVLAEAIQKNSSLQKINLKGNKAIQAESLEKLSQALTNTKIMKVEIDEFNRNCDNPQSFMEIVKQINAICTINKTKAEQTADEEISSFSMCFARKVSLSCEPIYYSQPCILNEPVSKSRKKSPSPSPIPSPGCSPTPRSRFSVSRVPDNSLPKPNSRFKVFTVSVSDFGGSTDNLATSPPPDDDDEVRQFANVRSSVSSIDSVDSISTNRDSVYDSATPSGESD